jgi:hypothetical protein
MHSTTEMKGLSRTGQPATPRLVPSPLELPNTRERIPKWVDNGDCDESRTDVPSWCSCSPSGLNVSSVHLRKPSTDEPNQTEMQIEHLRGAWVEYLGEQATRAPFLVAAVQARHFGSRKEGGQRGRRWGWGAGHVASGNQHCRGVVGVVVAVAGDEWPCLSVWW